MSAPLPTSGYTIRVGRARPTLRFPWLLNCLSVKAGKGQWSLYFYDVLLGRLDERDYKDRG